nr:glycosyltransferase [Listeria seeligeri]
MGRLSPEKNQQMMIAAFQKLQEEFPDTNLFIIGSGELEDTLKTYVTELSLDDKVHFLGQLDNPFATIAACDAFLLSSMKGNPWCYWNVSS